MKKPIWKTADPTKADKKLSSKQKSSAKAAAKKAGRPYPNLVDNMNAARKKK
jgi:ribosomal protein L15E